MISKQITNATNQQAGRITPTYLLGTLGMLGSPMLLLEGLLVGFQQTEVNQLIGALSLIYIGGWLSSVAGLRLLKATGNRILGQAILVIQLIGLILAAGWSTLHIIYPDPNTNTLLYQVTDAAWPLSHLFMIIVGIFTIVAKTQQGWFRFAPLWCGLALPVAILAGVVAGEQAMSLVFSIYTTVAFMLLGYAVRKGES